MGITSRTFKISLFSLGSRNCSFSSLTASGLEALQALNRFIPDVLCWHYYHLCRFCEEEQKHQSYSKRHSNCDLMSNVQQLEPLLAFFASFVLDMPLVQQIMRWDMAVLRESPWYHEILSFGEQKG